MGTTFLNFKLVYTTIQIKLRLLKQYFHVVSFEFRFNFSTGLELKHFLCA